MPDFHQDEQPSSARDYRLSPRKVAMWASVIAVTAVVALIAVAVINDADALNTVALYLAVIAFVAQLIMYVAQNESSARQLKASQDVQRETSMMLRGIQESSTNMQRLLDRQYTKVIDALVARTGTVLTEERLRSLLDEGEGDRGSEHDEQSTGVVPDAEPEPDHLQEARESLRDELLEELRTDLEQTARTAARASYADQSTYLPLASASSFGASVGSALFPAPNVYPGGAIGFDDTVTRKLQDPDPFVRSAAVKSLYDNDPEAFKFYFDSDARQREKRVKARRATEHAEAIMRDAAEHRERNADDQRGMNADDTPPA